MAKIYTKFHKNIDGMLQKFK